MPALALAAERYADGLREDEDELQLASACEDAEAARSGTPIDPELKSQGGTEIVKVPVTGLLP